jgi:N6-L-threonylcarbamoyladenine synthase/protein kinase Bud32
LTSPERLLCLGVEGTAHTFAVSIVDSDGNILTDIKDSYIPPPGGGIHPREAARHHSEVADKLLAKALEAAKVKPDQLQLIAFSMGPGMGPCLRTAATLARTLASYLSLPLVGVNHLLGHIEIGKLTAGAKDAVVLTVSGGTTNIVAFDEGRYRVFGETLDISIGNCFDVFAREAGIYDPTSPWPGPAFDKCAAKGSQYLELPYTVKGMDFSFSGILTSALTKYRDGYRIEDVAFSLQETALAAITEAAERALAHLENGTLLVTGGFARNKRLNEMLSIMTKDRGDKLYTVPPQYATDNAAMIAWTGILIYQSGTSTPIEKSLVKPKWRIDEVDVPWLNKD